MRLKQRQRSHLPPINLIPMLNAMLAILAFFVLVAISLSREKSLALRLPADRYPTPTEAPPFVIVQRQDQLWVGEEPQSQIDVLRSAQAYLQRNPEGFILLRPDPDLSYQQIIELLLPLQQVGGDRVSLVVWEEDNAP